MGHNIPTALVVVSDEDAVETRLESVLHRRNRVGSSANNGGAAGAQGRSTCGRERRQLDHGDSSGGD